MIWRCCIECGRIYRGGINCEQPRCIGVGEPLPDSEPRQKQDKPTREHLRLITTGGGCPR